MNRQSPFLLRVFGSCLAALTLSGCSILFDSASQEGVQIVKSPGRGGGECESATDVPSSAVLDLRYVQELDQRASTGAGGRGVSLTSSDAVRELKARRSPTPAERKLVRGISHFDRDETGLARRIIDQSLIGNLRLAADRAVAYMYRGFMLCGEQDKSACALQFRRMYAEVPGFLVTEDGHGYRRWSSVLDEVTAEHRGSSTALANGPTASSHMHSTLQVSSTADGGSQLLLNIRPGGSIVFDGKLVGESPPIRIIKVNPGVHTFALTGGRGEPFAADVDIGAGEQIEIRRDAR